MFASPFLFVSLVFIVLAILAVLLGTPMRNILTVAVLSAALGVVILLSGCSAPSDPCCITYQHYVATMDAPTPTPVSTVAASKFTFQP